MKDYKFLVFTEPIEREIGGEEENDPITTFAKHECVFLPEEEADYWVEKGKAAPHLWICKYCGKTHAQLECPYKCSNPDCENTREKEKGGFEPIHPTKHYEMSDCIAENFHFLSVNETRTTEGIGKIYLYDGGIYREEGVVGFIKKLVKEAAPRKRNTYRNEVVHGIADKYEVSVSQDSLGLKGPKVAVQNGILNLETLEVKDFDPEEKALNKIPHNYEPEAECPRFKEKLKEWVPSERGRKHLQELLGTALHPEKLHKKMGILVGPTDAGKSTFIELIRYVIGKENVEGQSPHDLAERWGPDKIFGVLLNATDEVRAEGLEKLDKLKKIADGNPIVAEEKGKKTYTFEPTCEHLFGANMTPDAERQDNAFWNRWLPMEFPEEIPEKDQNPDLVEELKEEAEGILNWLIEGYRSFSENGNKFTDPISWEEAREIWLNWGSAIQRFIQENVEKGTDEDRITSRRLYEKVCAFADRNDLPAPSSPKKVTQEFKKLSFASYGSSYTIDGKSNQRGFKGISVKTDLETSQNQLAKKLTRDYHELEDPEEISISEFAREEASRYAEKEERISELLERLKEEEGLIFSNKIGEVEDLGGS